MEHMENLSGIRQEYERDNRHKELLIILCALAVVVMGCWFITVGVADTTVSQVLKAIAAAVTGRLDAGTQADNAANKIIVLMRLPRIVAAVLAGAGLSVSGVAMQGVTRNPLVSPFTIGISNAAAFGASVFIVFSAGTLAGNQLGTVICAFLSAICCAALVYMVSKKVGMGPQTIVLVGIALNYLFSAMTSAIEFFAQEHKLAAVVNWTFGTFNGITWNEVLVIFVFVFCCMLIMYRFCLALDIMAGGEDEIVRSLGINPERVRVITGVLSVLMTAAIISFTGVIGFVGLVAPHIARILIGGRHRYLLPFSAVLGAALLLVADTVGKTILSPVSIPVGIVVSFLGVPLFVHLILNKRGYAQ